MISETKLISDHPDYKRSSIFLLRNTANDSWYAICDKTWNRWILNLKTDIFSSKQTIRHFLIGMLYFSKKSVFFLWFFFTLFFSIISLKFILRDNTFLQELIFPPSFTTKYSFNFSKLSGKTSVFSTYYFCCKTKISYV